MGKFSEVFWEEELLRKFRLLFEETCEKLRRENPESSASFEDFVSSLDVDDKVTRRLFEFLVKETLSKSSQATNTTENNNHSTTTNNTSTSNNNTTTTNNNNNNNNDSIGQATLQLLSALLSGPLTSRGFGHPTLRRAYLLNPVTGTATLLPPTNPHLNLDTNE